MISLLSCCCFDFDYVDYKWIVSETYRVKATYVGGVQPIGYVFGQGGFVGGTFEAFRNHVLSIHFSGIYPSSSIASYNLDKLRLDGEIIKNDVWGFGMSNGNGTYSECEVTTVENYKFKSCC